MQHVRRLIVTLVLLASCSSPQAIPPGLPENILAEPLLSVGIVAPSPASQLATALRALGIQHRQLPHLDITDADLDGISCVIVDELALDVELVPRSLPRLYDHARASGRALIILMQSPEKGLEALRTSAGPIEARPVGYDVTLVVPQQVHRVLMWPNAISTDDVASYSGRTRQLARGKNGRAVLAGNYDRPDSSAAILRSQYNKGSVWYVAFPFIDRAADGHAAEQRLLGNLMSIGLGD
jgi:hypothetical protein